MSQNIHLSVAVPIYNETLVLEQLCGDLIDVLESLELPAGYELVFCNDGSTDGSGDKLDELAYRYAGRVRVIHLARNFGHAAALMACLEHVSGNPVILMDGDMQDCPSAFQVFLEKWRQGFDVVYAVRSSREESRILRMLIWLFYRGLRHLANIDLPLDAGNFCLIDRRVVNALRQLPERNLYFPGLRAWTGFRQIGVNVARKARYDRKSRVGIRGLWTLAGNAVFSFSYVPLYVFRIVGLLAAMLAVFFFGYDLVLSSMDNSPYPPNHVFLIVILLLTSVNLLGLALLGEYVARIYDEIKGRPRYIVSRVTEAQKETGPGIPPQGTL